MPLHDGARRVRPSARFGSLFTVDSCAVPFSWDARPPSLAILRCSSGSIAAKPRARFEPLFFLLVMRVISAFSETMSPQSCNILCHWIELFVLCTRAESHTVEIGQRVDENRAVPNPNWALSFYQADCLSRKRNLQNNVIAFAARWVTSRSNRKQHLAKKSDSRGDARYKKYTVR